MMGLDQAPEHVVGQPNNFLASQEPYETTEISSFLPKLSTKMVKMSTKPIHAVQTISMGRLVVQRIVGYAGGYRVVQGRIDEIVPPERFTADT
ncbi:hypothetical protein JCM33374_g6463 [Metschnikowia sp. JCM 33374]|nr:hypothetical protein JCM33374_g6463 [Metschnikowia sp. JCM 33374]